MTNSFCQAAFIIVVLTSAACGNDPSPNDLGEPYVPGDFDPPTDDDLPPTCDTALAPQSTAPSTSAPWDLEVMDLAVYPLAVCNDGSPAVFGIRRNPASTKWLIWLKGGGSCEDDTSCAQRAKSSPNLMSSIPAVQAFQNGNDDFPSAGAFAVDPLENPTWHNANLVEMLYCSSDTWQGDKAATADTPVTKVQHWHFRGHEIVKGVISTLLANEGLAQATDVTLGGGSAGAGGVYANADDVAALMPRTARYVALPDAGFRIDYPAFDPVTGVESTASPSVSQLFLAAAHVNWGGRGDASCDAVAVSDEDHAMCRSGSLLSSAGHITTPLFIINSELDHNPLGKLGIDDVEHITEAESAYITRFGAAMRAALALVEPRHAVFADYSTTHVSVGNSLYVEAQVDGVIMRDAVDAWHHDPCSASHRIDPEGPPLPVTE